MHQSLEHMTGSAKLQSSAFWKWIEQDTFEQNSLELKRGQFTV